MKRQDRKDCRGPDKIRVIVEWRSGGRQDREGARTLARRWDGVRFGTRLEKK